MGDNIKIGLKQDGSVNWINLAEDRDKRQALVTMVMNI
jgi:hypothetical protein